MTNKTPDSHQPDVPPSLEQAVRPLLTDLLYPSESDEPVDFVACYLQQEGPLTVSQVKDWLMIPPATYVEEIPEADFWSPVLAQEDWYGAEEKERASRFQSLKYLLENYLTDRQVFRVGETEVDVYLLGRTNDGSRAGIKTTVIET